MPSPPSCHALTDGTRVRVSSSVSDRSVPCVSRVRARLTVRAMLVCVKTAGAATPAHTMPSSRVYKPPLLQFDAFDTLVRELPHAGIEQFRPAYVHVARTIRDLSTTVGRERPTISRQAHPFVQQHFPEVARDKLSPGTILDKQAFLEAACTRPSPFADADRAAQEALDSDLLAAIDVVASAGAYIVPLREQRMDVLRNLARLLEPMRASCDAAKGDCAARIAKRFNVAWAAAAVDGIGWPDTELPLRYIIGHPVIFDVPDSGVFRADEKPAEIAPAQFEAANTRVVASISREVENSARHGDESERERRRQCWKRTREEIDDGLVSEPMTRAVVDRKYGRGKWRCMGRNAIWQKNKYRCIDNGKRSKHNKATTLHERITCGRADFPVTISREFARRAPTAGLMRHPLLTSAIAKLRRPQQHVQATAAKRAIKRFRMRHGTNDLYAAYRRVPTRRNLTMRSASLNGLLPAARTLRPDPPAIT